MKKKKRNIKKTGTGYNFEENKATDERRKKKITKSKNISKNLPIKRTTTKLKLNGKLIKGLTKSKSTSQIGRKSLSKKNGKSGKRVKKKCEFN